jgi:uncharacterized RDD family membrane protein YckC
MLSDVVVKTESVTVIVSIPFLELIPPSLVAILAPVIVIWSLLFPVAIPVPPLPPFAGIVSIPEPGSMVALTGGEPIGS